MSVNVQYETADLGLAAFLLIRGMMLVDAGRKNGRYNFIFENNEECKKLAVVYINSDFSSFDAALKNLKNLVN